ncbi:MAG: transporter substrate-binding domain-containing protein [Hyphomonadaceae bacterium]
MADAKAELARTGVLRAAINMSNFLLVTDKAENGDPIGVAPDMAAAIAAKLGVPLKLVPFPNPGALADAAEDGLWDVGLIGAEPARAEKIAFTAAYVEIESTYIVPAGSPFTNAEQVDQAGVRIAVMGRSAYGLWLDRNLKHAALARTETMGEALDRFREEKLEALAGLRPGLIGDLEKLPAGARILDGRFTAVQQAIGTQRANTAGAAFLSTFVEDAKASGFVAQLIAKHKVQGLSVAPKGA